MEVKFAKFWFEDLLSLHARAQGKKNKQKTKNFSALPALMIVSWTTSSMERSSKYDKLCNQMRSKNFTNEIFAFKVAGNSFFETPKDYIQSAQKPTFLLRGQTNFTRINQRFEAWDCGRVMTIAIILLVLISVWERSRKFLDRFSHNSRIFFIEIMPRCRTYFNKWNLSVSKLWRRWFYSWIFSVSTWNYFQKEL